MKLKAQNSKLKTKPHDQAPSGLLGLFDSGSVVAGSWRGRFELLSLELLLSFEL